MGAGLHEKARRISIYHNSTGHDQNYNYSMSSIWSHIRSLIMFQLDESLHSFRHKFKFSFRVFRLLRVLDLEGSYIFKFPPELVELIYLRYLSLRSTKISVLPKSVGKHKNLETLDLKKTRVGVSKLPVEILKLQCLHHLLVYSLIGYGVSVPSGIGNLTCLQNLKLIDVGHQVAAGSSSSTSGVVMMKELGKLTQLRQLGIGYLRGRHGRDLCLALKKMEHLHTLKLHARWIYEEEEEVQLLELESLISPPQHPNNQILLSHPRRICT